MIEAAFDCATRLFGLSFAERKDVPVWHPDVRVWEVRDRNGKYKALFYGDYFARPSKRSGAWMTSLRDQQKLDGEIAPLIINVCNFSKGADGQPSLLSPDDARNLFHEFGHGLHGMLSNVTYPSLSGTACSPISSNCPPSSTSTGRNSPRCCGNLPGTTRPASRCRTIC